MTGRTLTAIMAVILGVAFLCVGGIVAVAGAASTCSLIVSPGGASIARYDAEQVHNVQIIVSVGAQRGIPVRGQIIAVATAIQESNLRNLPNLGNRNDHDSLGLFQQRPSQGWGTPEQILNQAYATGRFYDKLITIAGWQSMPLTDAAQAVQTSAYPDAYAKWETDATALTGLVASTIPGATSGDLEHCVNMTGWARPVLAPVVSGFRTPQRPTHDGVDLGAARGTPVRAAAAGTVLTVQCNVDPASHGCDRDGSPQIGGCGWYVDVAHAGGVITRYCHLGRRPFVEQGQQIAVGQIIGVVGSSGNSSGPHLHFEVHMDGDQSRAGAVDPVPFLAAVGAPMEAT